MPEVDDETRQAEDAAVSEDNQSEGAGSQSKQDVELPQSLKGWISPEAFAGLSKDAQGALVDKAKSLEGHYTKLNQEVAPLRRLQEELASEPEKAEHIRRAVAEYEARKAGIVPTTPSDTKAAKSRLDALLDGEEPSKRKAVMEFVEGLDERYKSVIDQQQKELGELKTTLKSFLSDAQVTRREVLERDLGNLTARMKALAEKYRETILSMGSSKSGMRFSAEKLVQIAASPEELRQAYLADVSSKDRKETERLKESATEKPTGAVGATEAFGEDMKNKVPPALEGKVGKTWNLEKVVSKLWKEAGA